jgi:hypothetical protein
MRQERVVRVAPRKPANPEVVEETALEEADAGLLSDIDELLDEIDSVLEDQSTLVNFRQRSGQ